MDALLIERGGALEREEYGSGYDAASPHALYSGTKSFWGVAALIAQREGLLDLDEHVAQTCASWKDDDRKRRVTLRMLLQLTAGFGFGGLGASVPTYDAALAMPLRNDPGTQFTYGGIALQVFGAVLTQKLEPLRMTPVQYLRERVLDPAGVRIAAWRTLRDGANPLPTGAQLTGRDWLAYGTWVLAHRDELDECFRGSDTNPRYGLAWWLGAKGAPPDLVYASGAGGQALYLIASQALAIVRFGNSASPKHDVFLRRLLS
jgi:CubicO group peptidase (beta-lactamase class C family)